MLSKKVLTSPKLQLSDHTHFLTRFLRQNLFKIFNLDGTVISYSNYFRKSAILIFTLKRNYVCAPPAGHIARNLRNETLNNCNRVSTVPESTYAFGGASLPQINGIYLEFQTRFTGTPPKSIWYSCAPAKWTPPFEETFLGLW